MILGNEMQNIQIKVMQAIRQEIFKESGTNGDLETACKNAITMTGVYKYVYAIGSPDLYNRRYNGGGLADPHNLFGSATQQPLGSIIEIEDKTPENGDGVVNADPLHYLSDLIESGGHGPRWPDSDWPGPRPYLEDSCNDGCMPGGEIDKAAKDVADATDLSGI